MVGAVRFELTTSCTRNKRATRLRYAPTQRVAEVATLGCDCNYFCVVKEKTIGKNPMARPITVQQAAKPMVIMAALCREAATAVASSAQQLVDDEELYRKEREQGGPGGELAHAHRLLFAARE